VTGVPLAVVLELNEPQVAALLPGVQLQVTPPFAESLATVAVMLWVALTCSDVGTALSVVVMGWDLWLELLQATRAAIMPRLIRRRNDLRNLIAHLRSLQPWMSFRLWFPVWNVPYERRAHVPAVRSRFSP